MSASDLDSLQYGSSDDGSDFEGFTAADIRESERRVAASAANAGGVGIVDSDSSDSSDSESDEVNISYTILFSSVR